jgi:hypothetical protein
MSDIPGTDCIISLFYMIPKVRFASELYAAAEVTMQSAQNPKRFHKFATFIYRRINIL